MYSLTPPTRDGLADYDNIAAKRRTGANLLLEQRPAIVTAYANYLAEFGKGSLLHPIPVSPEIAKALEDNFDALKKGRSHESVRDEILDSTPSDSCPYCNMSDVDTIDHALPKSVYPEFSILALNLIPACGACNLRKGQSCHVKSGYDLMHPYFVCIPDEPILFAEVMVDVEAVTWRFYLQNNAAMGDAEFGSIEKLFNLLDLARRYSRYSVGEIGDRAGHFDELHSRGGADTLRSYLEKEAASSRESRGNNYWKTALLHGLADNDPFCDGGYKKL